MDGMQVIPTPRRASIAITGRCNLRCGTASTPTRWRRSATCLPGSGWLSLTSWPAGSDGRNLDGGEPFTRPDLFELIDGIVVNRMRYSVLSNGTLIDERTLAQFQVGKRRLRLNYVQVSIDGSRAEIHDRSRPNSFGRAVRGLRLLKEAGLPAAVRVTINRHNLHDLENVAHLLLDEIGLPSFGTNEAMPIGSGCRNERECRWHRPSRPRRWRS